MDLAKIQQINSLAQELRKHNFAASSEDAYQQAEQTIEHQHQHDTHETAHTSHFTPTQQSETLSTKKTELLIEMNNKKYEQEFSLLRSALNSLAQELGTLRGQVAKLSAQQPKEIQQPLPAAPKKEPAREAHPRQGNVTPEDVDIQKMFYFGNK